ncbi:hypothetical protein MG5_00198 [Candida albicans P57072]|nr:hypothetical protein MG5_00198 [Candida albicans P57072]KHC43051.1 hypothetical protein MGQ_00197 [Candida albicans P76067]
MTSTQTHKVIMGIRSEHRGILCHEQNTSGNTFFSIVLVLFFLSNWFCAMCEHKYCQEKKACFVASVRKKFWGSFGLIYVFIPSGKVGGEKILSSSQNLPKNIWTKMIVFSRHQNHN